MTIRTRGNPCGERDRRSLRRRIRPVAVVCCAVFLLASASVARGAKVAASEADDLPSLDRLLAGMQRVAGLYLDEALSFTCNETIHFAGHGEPVLLRFRYVYRYSESDRRLYDYRVPRADPRAREIADPAHAELRDYGLPEFMLRAYSWAFLFLDAVQAQYRYEIEGRDEVLGRPAIRLRFEPIPPYTPDVNDWRGRAFIDKETFQLLRVEAQRVEDDTKRKLLQAELHELHSGNDVARGSYEYSEFVTDFDVERNGMRFPGIVVIQRSAFSPTGFPGRATIEETPIYRITQTYKRYRFFRVLTRERIRSVVVDAQEDSTESDVQVR